MSGRTLALVFSAMLLIGVLAFVNVQLIKASGTIYIRADGSIDPPAANITSADNVTYVFTDNNYGEVVIKRDDIIVDGAGFTLQGTPPASSGDTNATANGIGVWNRNNVTIRDVRIDQFASGISVSESSKCTFVQNHITRSGPWMIGGGISMSYSSNITICGNSITVNGPAMELYYCAECNIFRNELVHNLLAFCLIGCSNNTVYENNVYTVGGVFFGAESSLNKFCHNNMYNDMDTFIGWQDCLNNTWDNGYPSGGNYWSKYVGTDSYRGLYQNIIGSDGIRDTPFVIDSSNRDNYPLMKPYGGPHDIGIISSIYQTILTEGCDLKIATKVINYGINDETFNITYHLNTPIYSQTLTLASRNSTILTFVVDTSGLLKGNHSVVVEAEPVINETDMSDNTFNSWIFITILGDIRPDGVVNILDAMLLAGGFACSVVDDSWNPNYDLCPDGVINILDAVRLASAFGNHW